MAGKRSYGRWQVEKSLDEGGQGWVYLVTNIGKADPGFFVLKRLKDRNRLDRFKQEVEVIQGLQHPNIIHIEDFEVTSEKPYYVMEYCERGSLDKIGGATFKGDIERAVATLTPICSALSAAHHQKIVHRDIKPPNILMRQDGTPVLGDFGICHLDKDERITMTDKAMGARDYTAPEMETGGQKRLGGPSEKTDVYCLGKVLFWMLSGGSTFWREDHRASPLMETLGDQRWEHVHTLLDKVLIERPSERLGLAQFVAEMQRVRNLVVGDFAPLKPSIGIKCRFCGLGTYERRGEKVTDRVAILRSTEPHAGGQIATVNLMLCNHCGHVELFDFGKTSAWWSK